MTESRSQEVPTSPLATLLNFRDIGQSIDQVIGQTLFNRGLLYRSARPDEASVEDRKSLRETYKIKTIVDLRSKTELLEQNKKFTGQDAINKEKEANLSLQYPFHIPGIKYKNIDLNGGSFSRALLWQLSWPGFLKFLLYMATGYRVEALGIMSKEVIQPGGLKGLGIGSLEYSKPEIRQVFSVMADAERYPILVHCTQGKDRTGLVILLTLLLLDVPVDAIQAEYMATERELAGEREKRLKEVGRIGLGGDFVDCLPTFAYDMKEHIDRKYGGPKEFLDACGVDSDMKNRVKGILMQTGGAQQTK